MLLVVSRFSSSVFLIGSRDFSPDSHFFFEQFLWWAKLASEEVGNCHNVTFRVESSQNRNHMMITIIQFDFHPNISLSIAPIWSFGFLFEIHTPLLTLCTWLFNVYATEFVEKISMYELEGYSAFILFADCQLVKEWGWIILGRHLVARSY